MPVIFQKMKENEITEIYETRMTKDFPPMELKPLHNIVDMMERGIYESLMVYDSGKSSGNDTSADKEPIGYALVLLPKGMTYGLLDYLGMFSEKRNQGYGGQVLAELAKHYHDRRLIIESEYPDDAPDRKMAERRLRFYQRNGAVDTGVESRVFGAHYVNLVLQDSKAEQAIINNDIKDTLGQLYTYVQPDAEKRRKYMGFWVSES